MKDLKVGDVLVSGVLDSYNWLTIKLDEPDDGEFCISEHEATLIITHLAAIFDIDLSVIKQKGK